MIPLGPRILVNPESSGRAGFAADAIGEAISSVIYRKNVSHVINVSRVLGA